MKRLLFLAILIGGLSACKAKEEHEYVDLGLSVKWAICNLGASNPEEYGDYYAWGEISPKEEYTESNCTSFNKSLNNIGGDENYDAARATWGGKWRIPTETEVRELIDNCTWAWTTVNGNNGYKITGPNGNTIFIPASGIYRDREVMQAGSVGSYWTSSKNGLDLMDNIARNLFYSDSDYFIMGASFDLGYTIRPVID